MADAIPAMTEKVTKPVKEEKVKQKDLVELPKVPSKVTLPDGTVIETY